jgi:hypothetical protein
VKYKIITPNPLYNGVTEGVPFASGVGHTDNENVKNSLVNNYGYRCEVAEAKPKKGAKPSGK